MVDRRKGRFQGLRDDRHLLLVASLLHRLEVLGVLVQQHSGTSKLQPAPHMLSV